MTVQAILERAIHQITGEELTLIGSGRTDAGAHAENQVITFVTNSSLPAPVLCRALNAVLPRDVAVTGAIDVEPSFHPRHDARSRTYRYLIWNRQIRSPFWEQRASHVAFHLDVELMNQGASRLVGTHDFSSFAPAKYSGDRVRTLFRCAVSRDGYLVKVEVEGSGFMKQMVRSIVGTLIQVGGGRIQPSDVERILISRNRARAGETAPSAGLYLITATYPHERTDSESWHAADGYRTSEEEN